MKIVTYLATILLAISQVFTAPDPNFHIYLAFGQSNMEGRGKIYQEDKTVDSRFQMIATVDGCKGRKFGEWNDAIPPLSNCNMGQLGPADYFGRTLVKKLPHEIKIGIAVVAIGDCDIQLFEKTKNRNYRIPNEIKNTYEAYGRNSYSRLIEMGKKAQEVGVIRGILLHHGENNIGQTDWPNRVKAIYDNILNDLDLNSDDVPLLAGEVVSSEKGGKYGEMNPIIHNLAKICSTCHIISSQNLDSEDDGFHFTTNAYRTLGERYAEEMLKIHNYNQSAITTNNCWAHRLGFQCCKNYKIEVAYSDSDGDWGIENGEWCGIDNTCWSETLGYPCCNTNGCQTIYFIDSNGMWSVENDNWCGITPANTIC
ncbi:acetylxylan esterase [Anaeromyces robustus]|uniref:Acetylxylan esterase n=1 Tax=Anaeromyces robustus TaxID=1754192 RepID=A0A1Y1X8S7_9FUNG|nr:acetylxylan esterase [Anaeromyces robustus]|eukprot:ORX82132.1 acetylxylan esterase [Anaeromyces robustus]